MRHQTEKKMVGNSDLRVTRNYKSKRKKGIIKTGNPKK
jgi:hypothetical protein